MTIDKTVENKVFLVNYFCLTMEASRFESGSVPLITDPGPEHKNLRIWNTAGKHFSISVII
jgi:hypothetical protein